MGMRGGKYLLIMAATVIPYAQSLPAASVLQPTPPMGFNNWARVMCNLNESVFVDTAQAMVKNGLLKAGYNRINLDDCWSTMERASNGSMEWNSTLFPKGLPWLTNYLKNLGFHAGIYTDSGLTSCGGYPGGYGFEELDSQTFASWGFDYLKVDGCNLPSSTEQEYKTVYKKWGDALSKNNPPTVFSESAPAYFAEVDNLTDWYSVMGWVRKFGQLARHSRDSLVYNSSGYFPGVTGWDSLMHNYGQEVRLARYQQPGYFNDPDFLNVDHPDYTIHEKRTHFALWSSLSAPLIISAWIPSFTSEEIEYLTNEDIIEVNQDPLALQATLVSQDGVWDVLTKSLANGDRLLTLLNGGNRTASYKIKFDRIGLSSVPSVRIKDLWTGDTIISTQEVTATDVPPHGTAIFRISGFGGARAVIPTGMIFNTYSLRALEANHKSLHWNNATAESSQVWQTESDGTMSPLSSSGCVTEVAGKVLLRSCTGKPEQKWDYHITGNLKNRKSGKCLTESELQEVTISDCLYEANSQVLGLPSGVNIVQN